MTEFIDALLATLDGPGSLFTFWIAGVGAVLVAVAFAGFVGNWLAKRLNAALPSRDDMGFVARRGVPSPE